MTLLVALRGTDGLVLACDSRGTFGDPRGVTAQNDSQQKAHVLSRYAAVLMAGSGDLGTTLVTEARQRIVKNEAVGVTSVMGVFRETARELYAEWFPHLEPDVPGGSDRLSRPDLYFILAGYDEDDGAGHTVPRIFHLPSGLDFPPFQADYGFGVGGVGQYAIYLLNRLYDAERTMEDLISLAVYVITETASQDGKVGGPVRVVTITPQDGCTTLPVERVAEMIEANEARQKALRDSFYRRAPGADGDAQASG